MRFALAWLGAAIALAIAAVLIGTTAHPWLLGQHSVVDRSTTTTPFCIYS